MKKLSIKSGLLITGIVGFLISLLWIELRTSLEFKDVLMWRALAVGGFMIYLWLTEAIEIYVTALIPLLVGMPLGIIDDLDIAKSYGNVNIYLFLGGFIIALALEKHDVHKQIAKRIIKVVGNSKARLLLGFILSTGFLSMWISNTATALMMLPMGLAILAAMPKHKKKSKFGLFLLLSIAYSASVGGMATLVGSPPNGIMSSIVASEPYNIKIEFIDWMKIGIPLSLMMMLAVYFVFYFLMGKERNEKLDTELLGHEPWTITQKKVLGIFALAVILWSFKSLIATYLHFDYQDLFPAILCSVLLFILPKSDQKDSKILHWKDTKNVPWGILILFGGGIALAKMLEANGVITIVADAFIQYKDLGTVAIMTIVVTVAVFGTELMSNTALVNVFIPVIAAFAMQSDYSVVQLCVPVALAASCAFMLPVGTPPNAIVFSSGEVRISQMARYGFVLNVIAVVLIVMMATLFL